MGNGITDADQVIEDQIKEQPTHYDGRVTVTVKESLGVLFLGIIAITLLIAYIRSQRRNRELLGEQKQE